MRERVIWATRYVLPGIICLVGLVFILVDFESNWEGGMGIIGAGLSVLLLNFLYRVGVQGDRDRDREDAQRRYFDAHGHWPDERRR